MINDENAVPCRAGSPKRGVDVAMKDVWKRSPMRSHRSPGLSPRSPLMPKKTSRRVSFGPSPTAAEDDDSIAADEERLPTSERKLRQSMLEVDAVYTLSEIASSTKAQQRR